MILKIVTDHQYIWKSFYHVAILSRYFFGGNQANLKYIFSNMVMAPSSVCDLGIRNCQELAKSAYQVINHIRSVELF